MVLCGEWSKSRTTWPEGRALMAWKMARKVRRKIPDVSMGVEKNMDVSLLSDSAVIVNTWASCYQSTFKTVSLKRAEFSGSNGV